MRPRNSYFVKCRWALLVGTFWWAAAPRPGWARWATADDAQSVTKSFNEDIVVEKDGTYTEEIDWVKQVLREGGRNLSTHHLHYNSGAGDLKVLAAETINGAETTKVDRRFIEDKPEASRLYGFDQTNLVAIAFPKVGIGSQLHLRYREKVHGVPLKGQFFKRFDIGLGHYVLSGTATIRSKLPLFVETNDPRGVLEVAQRDEKDVHVVSIHLIRPESVEPIDEPWAWLERTQQTWVVVSSAKDYAVIGDEAAPQIEEVLSAPLPPLYRSILEDAQTKTETVDRINTVTAELNAKLRYMGDWRSVLGGHVPRPLQTAAETRFGDCKDFSAATVVILRELGLEAHQAWVERGINPSALPKLGGPGFNHAIVYAYGDGRVWWIDPTNFASFARGTFPDIAGRQALVLDPGHSRLETIPESKPEDGIMEESSTVRVQDDGKARIETVIGLKGVAAAPWTGLLLRMSADHVDHEIITRLGDEARIENWEVEPLELKSRITEDVTIKAHYTEKDYSIHTTAGPGLFLNSRDFEQLMRLDPRNRVSDFFVGHPDTLRETMDFPDIRLRGNPPPQCNINSPWAKVSRKVTQATTGLTVESTREILVPEISNSALKSAEFARFQKELRDCFDRIAVVYESSKPVERRGLTLRQ